MPRQAAYGLSKAVGRVLLTVAGAAVVFASSVPGAPVSVGHQVASADGWRASFTLAKTGALQYSDLHLTVLDGSQLVLDQPVTSSLRGVGNRLKPGGFYGRSSVSFRDRNGHGTKELLLALFTGGARRWSRAGDQAGWSTGARPPTPTNTIKRLGLPDDLPSCGRADEGLCLASVVGVVFARKAAAQFAEQREVCPLLG